MDAKDIKDNDSLQAWLEARPEASRQADAEVIAQRAAMRVLPLVLRGKGRSEAPGVRSLALPILRLLLASGVPSKHRSPEVVSAVIASNAAAFPDRTAFAVPFAFSNAAESASLAASFAADVTSGVAPSGDAACAASFASDAIIAFTFSSDASDAIWQAITADCSGLAAGSDPSNLPLWPEVTPEALTEAELAGLENLAIETGDRNSFWHRWWFAMKRGEPMDWDFQRDVALIPEDIWQAGPKAMLEEIGKIEARFALAATENAEVIEPNPATGKLRLVPTSSLPEEIGVYARRKIVKAVEVLDHPGALQQHGAIAPDLVMLRRAVEDAGNMAVELYDASVSAVRRLQLRAAQGECPPPDQDPILADYRDRLIEAAADILGHDPQTQDVLDRRNRIKGNRALIDAAQTLQIAVQIVLPATEGCLAETLPLDMETATNPTADPELQKAASVRFAGRMAQIIAWAKQHPALAGIGAATTVVATGALGQLGVRGMDLAIDTWGPGAVEVLKSAWRSILTYLGF